ncbi:MAG: glycosyltransferase [Magnetococcales bacterium]|nr:glycosyltransferase [Magnetococcales bacterium]
MSDHTQINKEAPSVLMVAFHFPPAHGFSGTQRTLKFVRYLPEFGWQPLVLSANARAYPELSDRQMAEIPDSVAVKRAFALDAVRHFSLKGRYLRVTALPDRWSSWWLGGVISGMRMIRRHRPRVIWSTYPIASSHLIAATLSRLSGLPWVADFRDAMIIHDWPADRWVRWLFSRLEPRFLRSADRVVVANPGIHRLYSERYPEASHDRWSVVFNGYDEADFSTPLQEEGPNPRRDRSGPLHLVHSGRLYPGVESRDPSLFLVALSRLKQAGKIDAARLQVTLRATALDDVLRPRISELGLDGLVHLKPLIPYDEALQEMQQADGLLLFQGDGFDHMVPAKLFEYFRARLPILPFVGVSGDTAALLRAAGFDLMAPLGDVDAIGRTTVAFLDRLDGGTFTLPPIDHVQRFSRRSATGELATLLNSTAR